MNWGKEVKMETANTQTTDASQCNAGNENPIQSMETGGVASLSTMQEIPENFDESGLATAGQGPSGLTPIDDLYPAPEGGNDPSQQILENNPTPDGGENQGGKDPEKDAAFWQGKHDKDAHAHQVEMDNLKTEYAPAMQLDQQMRSDEGLRNAVNAYLNNEPAQPATPVVETAPERPANFDAFEAHNSPESESYKWREASEQFRIDQAINGVRSEFQEKSNKETAVANRRNAVAKIEAQAMQLANNDQTVQKEFITFMNSPESYSLDFMFQAFQASKGNANLPSAAQENFEQNARNNQMPGDPGLVSGQSPQVMNDQDQFNQGRKAMSQRKDY